MISIDGSMGEGGGQILRSSLALSLVTGKAISISNIRAGRKRPGLMRQHLTALDAAAQVGQAEVKGASLGSSRFSFQPSRPVPGVYTFRVGTAGSATLVFQTVLPALMIAEAPSTLHLEGGTHNPFAPSFDFLAKAYLPLVERMGPTVRATLDRPGFFPAGGGRFSVSIEPVPQLKAFDLLDRGREQRRAVRALVANLPLHIARRECDTIARKSGWPQSCFRSEEVRNASGPGNVVLVEIESEQVTEVFTGFGKRGVPAERVAADVWRETSEYLDAGIPVGTHLADQLMLPFGIAAQGGHGGAFRTQSLSGHATTHLDILTRFLDLETRVTKGKQGESLVEISESG
jgi:RNA 3'-terminal phosphate cyclase (ATP)